MAKYTPKGTPVTRVEKMLKDTISECDQDREMALAFLEQLRETLEDNPDDYQTRVLISKALELLQSSKTHRLKALDVLTKIKLKELDLMSRGESPHSNTPTSFEDFMSDD